MLTPELKRAIALSAAVLVTAGSLFAFPGFEEAKIEADRGNAQAQAIVATYYALGWQTSKDPALAIRYAEQSANAGNPLGKFRLGALLRNGEGVANDEATGLRLQSDAAAIWSKGFDEGDPFALTAIGVALFQGKVVKQDKAQAARLYKKAADMEFAPAQFNFAMCAKDGMGIPKDQKLYAEYIAKAAAGSYKLAIEILRQTESRGGNVVNESANMKSFASSGSISGSLSIISDEKTNNSPILNSGATSKQITVVGVGSTPEDAEKQALKDAVRQSVGAYVDSNTLVQNEEVIRDRILSVSNGFIKEYKPAGSASRRSDGLYEITITATVETKRVVQALKDNNIISGEIAGQNIWAEATSKVMNAQDAVAMLEAKLPELIQSATIISFLDRDGRVTKNTNPVTKKENPDGTIDLTWFVSVSVDKKIYNSEIVPLLKTCFEAITGSVPISFTEKAEKNLFVSNDPARPDEVASSGNFNDSLREDLKFTRQVRTFLNNNEQIRQSQVIVETISNSLDVIQGFYFPNPRFTVGFRYTMGDADEWPVQLKLSLLNAQAQIVASKSAMLGYDHSDDARDYRECRIPFFPAGRILGEYIQDKYALFCIPTYYSAGTGGPEYGLKLSDFLTVAFQIKLPIDEAKMCQQIECKLIAPKLKLELRSK